MYNYLWTLAYVIILNFIYVIVALVLWYHLWVKHRGGTFLFSSLKIIIVEIPIEKNVVGLDKR